MSNLLWYGIIAIIVIIGFVITFRAIKRKDKNLNSISCTKKPITANEYNRAKISVGVRVFVQTFPTSRKNPYDSNTIKKKIRSLKQENGKPYSKGSVAAQYHGINKIFELEKEEDMLREAVKSKKVSLWIRLLAYYYLWRY